jgi:serine/threonine protein kinase
MKPGHVLDDRFRIEEQLGEGAMGVVFRASHLLLGGEPVAVKVIHPQFRRDSNFEARFIREARNARKVTHPNVVAVREFGKSPEDILYLVMDYVEGETLERIMAEERYGMPLPRIVRFVEQIAAALDAIHAQGVIHRDLKPSNVMVGAGGRLKVLDFGIARAAGDQTITVEGRIIGTAEYIAPEQILGKKADSRSDQYCLGLVMYELICGARPFGAQSSDDYLRRQVEDVPVPLASRRSDVPGMAEAVVLRMLSKDPAQRYPSTGEAAADFKRAVSSRGAGAESEDGDGWLRHQLRRLGLATV